MDFDRKYKENLGFSQPAMFFPENYVKPPYVGGGGDGGFSLEPCSSKSLFQDYHHPDHQFPANASSKTLQFGVHHPDHQFPANASSKTLQFGVHTACLDPFENFTYGSSMNLDVYELKPFTEDIEMAENFPTNNGGGGGEGGYLLQHHHQRAAVVATAAAEMVGPVGFNCQEIKPVNFVIPDKVSCITGENHLYKKISMNSAKNRVSQALEKTHKGRNKPHVVKGQWTIEEDRWEI